MKIEEILHYLEAIVKLWPSFQILLNQFLNTPAAQREQVAKEINEAMKHAADTGGDTSKIGEIIKRGKL